MARAPVGRQLRRLIMHNGWKLSRIAAMFVIVFGIGGAAWAQDQCSMPTVGVGTGSVGNATGPNTCGVVITVTAVDGLGNATAMTAANTGNGNPYDGSEDTLVGIQNSSGNNLSAITLSSSVTGAEALFSFDGDGPCNLAFHTPYSWCMTAGFTGYEGPDNTFTNISTDKTRGTVKFTSAIPNAGSTWFALEGTPQSLVTVTPIQTAPPVLLTSGQTNDADFLFSATNGQIVDHKLHFPSDTPFPNGETTVNVLSSNVVLSNRDWPPFVIGTPFAPSQLFVKSGDNQAANGTDFGSIYEDTCYVSDPSTASEQQCPGLLAGDTTPGDLIGAIDLFDLASPKPTITPVANCATDACTAAMIHFFPTQTPAETWSPSSTSPNPACTSPLNGSPSSPQVDCYLNNVLNFQITGVGS